MRSFIKTLAIAGMAAMAGSMAHAQFPDRTIIAIVPFAPGGANDTMARLITPELSKILGQSVVVENKPGAAGNIGIEATAKAKPDGYTILFSATASTQNPAIFKTLPFDPIKDIQPVAKIGEGPYVIVTRPDLPVNSLKEFVDLAKSKPGELNGSAGGVGTRLSIELFQIQNDVTTQIIPYNGTGPATTAVLSGEVDFAIMDSSAMVGYLQSGRVKALAVAAGERLESIPDVPTTVEAGFPDYRTGTLFGVYTAAGVPQDVVDKLNAAVNKAIQQPAIAEQLRKLGAQPQPTTPAEFTEQYQAEIAQWKKIVADAKIPQME